MKKTPEPLCKTDFFLTLWAMLRAVGVYELGYNKWAIRCGVEAAYRSCRKRRIPLAFKTKAFSVLGSEFYHEASNYGLIGMVLRPTETRIEIELSQAGALTYAKECSPDMNVERWKKVAEEFHSAFRKGWNESKVFI